ncbi:adenylyl-sulfate kinase [Limnobacter sp.]|uniref:adenylyl-sulfate kinase n=1 Tax=Limnobacter sp. TaxID=2003368 RepID=UPI00311FC17B
MSSPCQHELIKRHAACVVWFTGLSGAGKTTLALALDDALRCRGVHTAVLDGDSLRLGLNSDLGFSPEDRATNVRRTAQVSKLMLDAGLVVIVSLISPQAESRDQARSLFNANQFFEVYLNTPLAVCEQRDPKGLYQLARGGDIAQFTGISAGYEVPANPDLVLQTHQYTISECLERLLAMLEPALKRRSVN